MDNQKAVLGAVVGAILAILLLGQCVSWAITSSGSCVNCPTVPLAPTVTPTPIPPTHPPGPVVSFTAFPTEVREGDPFILTWATIGADEVSITPILSDGTIGMAVSVPRSGSRVEDAKITSTYRDTYAFFLYASKGERYTVVRVSVKVICGTTWLVPNPPRGCPKEPWTGQITVQNFQDGIMFWEHSIHDHNIQALCETYNGSKLIFFASNDWQPSLPEPIFGIEPPPGFYRPVRNLGKAWSEMTNDLYRYTIPSLPGSARECLGWATAPEYTIDGFYQCERASKYTTCFLSGPHNEVYLVFYMGWSKWTGSTPTP